MVVGVFAFAVPKIASYGSAWAVVQQLSWAQVALLLVVAAFNLVTYWPRAMAALPGLGFWQAAVRYQTTISVTYTMPAGGVAAVGISYAMLRSWGFSLAEITLAELLDGIWDVFAKLAMPLAAVPSSPRPAATSCPSWSPHSSGWPCWPLRWPGSGC